MTIEDEMSAVKALKSVDTWDDVESTVGANYCVRLYFGDLDAARKLVDALRALNS